MKPKKGGVKKIPPFFSRNLSFGAFKTYIPVERDNRIVTIKNS